MKTNNKQLISQFRLPSYISGKSFADASKLISKKFEGRNDMISNNTKNELLKRLSEAQEFTKSQEQPEQSNQMALGGFEQSIIGQGFGEDATGTEQSAAIGAGLGAATTALDLGKTAFGRPTQSTDGLEQSAPINGGSMITGNALKGASAGMAFGPVGAGIGAVLGAGAGIVGAGKAKDAAFKNTNNFAVNTNKQSSDNYFANGGEIDPPIKKTLITKDELLNNPLLSSGDSLKQTDRFRYAIGEQPGVQDGKSGQQGYYLYYGKKPGDVDFNPNVNREFVNQSGYNTYMHSPQGQQYRRNVAMGGTQPTEQFSKGGNMNKYNDGGPIDPNGYYENLQLTARNTAPTESLSGPKSAGTTVPYTIATQPTVDISNANRQVASGPSIKDYTKYGAKKAGEFVKDNKDLLRYAPAVSNALQLANLKKPQGVRLDRLDNRYKPEYVDLAQQQNIVNQELNNVNSAIQQSGASQGASRAAMLGAQLNKTRALSGAYANAQVQNAQQNAQAQQFNLGIDQTNLGQSNQEEEINAREKSAYDTQKSQLLTGIGTNLRDIGKEEFYKKYPEAMGLKYDWKGRSTADYQKGKDGKYYHKESGEEYKPLDQNKSAKGGYLNQNVLDHINNMYTNRNKK